VKILDFFSRKIFATLECISKTAKPDGFILVDELNL